MLDRFIKPDVDKLKTKRDVPGLIRALNYKGDYERGRAAQYLGEIGDKRAIEPLINTLNKAGGGNAYVQKVAAALGRLGDPRAVEPLIAALYKFRWCLTGPDDMARALGQLCDPRAVDPLIERLRDVQFATPYLRAAAAEALGMIQDRRAMGPLTDAIKDSSHYVRNASADAREKMGMQVIRPAITRGGFGEPYCSDGCYETGGRRISPLMLNNQPGACGFCKRPVRASMYGEPECVVVPYENTSLFICMNCTEKGKAHLQDYQKCCVCGKPLEYRLAA